MKYSIVTDPLYYGVVAFFALIATALPAALGQQWLLPIGQTAALWLLCFVAWRRGTALHAARVLGVWVAVQFAVFFVVAFLGGGENAVPQGFAYRTALLEWLFGVGALPASWATEPVRRSVETLGVTLGATVSGGILGVWFLVRSINLFAFGAASAFSATSSVWGLLAGLQPWWLLRVVAYVGVVATFALPGYTGKWTPGGWSPGERRLFWVSAGLLVAALLLEVILPGVWAGMASARIA